MAWEAPRCSKAQAIDSGKSGVSSCIAGMAPAIVGVVLPCCPSSFRGNYFLAL